MMSKRVKEKVIGIVLLMLSISIIIFLCYSMSSFAFSTTLLFSMVLSALLLIFSFGMLLIGYKLLIFESIRPITLNEIRKRVHKLATKKKAVIPPIFVYLCGIDGSGKTTQINFISKHLSARQLKYRHVWLRWAAFVSYPLLALCRLLGYTKWNFAPKINVKYAEHMFYKNRAIAKAWIWLFTVDIFIHAIFRVKIAMKRGYNILCDRFVLDAVVDLICETKNPKILRSLVSKLLFSLIPKQSIILMLDINEEEAFKRKSDIPSIDYLKERRKLYLILADLLRIPVICGKQKPEQVYKEIVDDFLRHYPFWYAFLR